MIRVATKHYYTGLLFTHCPFINNYCYFWT